MWRRVCEMPLSWKGRYAAPVRRNRRLREGPKAEVFEARANPLAHFLWIPSGGFPASRYACSDASGRNRTIPAKSWFSTSSRWFWARS
jgi:hypothetical protein